MNSTVKMILIAFGFALVALCISIVYQQKKLNDFRREVMGSSAGQNSVSNVPKSGTVDYSGLQNVLKKFNGTIVSISGDQVIVNAELTDFSKPKNSVQSKSSSSDNFEKLEKKITVTVNNQTLFETKKMSDLKIGDTINVSADKSPYNSDAVTAQSIAVAGK